MYRGEKSEAEIRFLIPLRGIRNDNDNMVIEYTHDMVKTPECCILVRTRCAFAPYRKSVVYCLHDTDENIPYTV